LGVTGYKIFRGGDFAAIVAAASHLFQDFVKSIFPVNDDERHGGSGGLRDGLFVQIFHLGLE
jgi:hypothetical protein